MGGGLEGGILSPHLEEAEAGDEKGQDDEDDLLLASEKYEKSGGGKYEKSGGGGGGVIGSRTPISATSGGGVMVTTTSAAITIAIAIKTITWCKSLNPWIRAKSLSPQHPTTTTRPLSPAISLLHHPHRHRPMKSLTAPLPAVAMVAVVVL